MAETKGIWADVPPVVKGIIYLVGTGLTVGTIIYTVKAVKKRKAGKGSREELKDIKNELDDLNDNAATRQTLSPSTASAIANNLFTAMDGYGTDSTAIMKNLLMMKNQADWLAIRKAFGSREISSGKYNPTPNFTGTLDAALTDEVGATDVYATSVLNKYFKLKNIDLVL